MPDYEKDHIYAVKQDKIEDFVFDETVARVFADMIGRSVPGYDALNCLIPIVAKRFIQTNTNVYDLGCSLGEASLCIAKHSICSNVQIFAIDNSQAMIKRLKKRLAKATLCTPVNPICSDITEINIENASLVILNYTLQFVDQVRRADVIASIYSGLNKEGVLLLSEKITYEDADEEILMQLLHEGYKRGNDYSGLEISQKREALENVLIRDTHEQHVSRLTQAGFSKVFVFARYLNFVSYIAIK